MENCELCQCDTCKGETTEKGRKACRELRDKYLPNKEILATGKAIMNSIKSVKDFDKRVIENGNKAIKTAKIIKKIFLNDS